MVVVVVVVVVVQKLACLTWGNECKKDETNQNVADTFMKRSSPCKIFAR